MALKNITLTGAEITVTGLDGSNAAIRNDGADTIYAAKQPGITPGADGVLSLPAGGSAPLYGISGEIFMLGTGAATVISSDFNDNPFKTSAQGGSGADDVARSAINEHSGNAEIHVTADEKAGWNGKTTILEAAQVFSNPNLLINPDFSVNQRGKEQYSDTTKNIFCHDHWVLYCGWRAEYVASISPALLCTTYNPEINTWVISQTIENVERLRNMTITFSVGIVTGSTTFRILINDGVGEIISPIKSGLNQISYNVSPDALRLSVAVVAHGALENEQIGIYWAKLEIGNIATSFVPPDPATELTKCQRYYQIRSAGDIAAVDMRPSMQKAPTVTQLADGNYAYDAEI